MGEKRVSTRTLPTGEKVLHHPPTDDHPEGKMTLIREGSSLRDQLNASLPDEQARMAELQAAQEAAVEAKRTDQLAKGLPPEKSAI